MPLDKDVQPFHSRVLETFHHPAFSAAPVVAAPEKKKKELGCLLTIKRLFQI